MTLRILLSGDSGVIGRATRHGALFNPRIIEDWGQEPSGNNIGVFRSTIEVDSFVKEVEGIKAGPYHRRLLILVISDPVMTG